MRRLLLTLCLRAYPPAGRERDRNYLLDLALELSETYGVRRQAMSLVRGGIGERLASRRLRRGAGARCGSGAWWWFASRSPRRRWQQAT